MKLEVQKRNGKYLCSLDLPGEPTLQDLKEAFDEQCHYYPERQRWTNVDGAVLVDGNLAPQGVKNGSIVHFKDLGVQISWRLVFVLEYLGPILIAPLFYFQLPPKKTTLTQHVALALLIFHFVKRELETLFVHRFSHGSMPLIRLPINCAHYWLLCGVAISYYLFHPLYKGPFDSKFYPYQQSAWSTVMIYTFAAIMLFCEYCNFRCHQVLRNLRPRGSKIRSIPYGWGFDRISCANYFWEICAWLAFACLVNCLTAWTFLVVATLQMAEWAVKKHRNYCKEFAKYPRSRCALCPGIL